MNKSKCPICHSSHTIKYGVVHGKQTYKCADCGYRFRNDRLPSDYELWMLYQDRKQTIAELAQTLHVSESTIKRHLRNVSLDWEQPQLSGSGFVHLDVTYWGHNWGVMAAIDEATGFPLYVAFTKSETIADYKEAVASIEERGYQIRGIIIDGKKHLFEEFAQFKIQMCQFHMKQLVKRYLTQNPRLKAARALKVLMEKLTCITKDEFEKEYAELKETWHDTLYRRSKRKDGTTPFLHRRLRTVMISIDFYLPYLFTYQEPECKGMPNTNNKIEGTFTDLKKNLNNHSGMSLENRRRFICGFFLALTKS